MGSVRTYSTPEGKLSQAFRKLRVVDEHAARSAPTPSTVTWTRDVTLHASGI